LTGQNILGEGRIAPLSPGHIVAVCDCIERILYIALYSCRIGLSRRRSPVELTRSSVSEWGRTSCSLHMWLC